MPANPERRSSKRIPTRIEVRYLDEAAESRKYPDLGEMSHDFVFDLSMGGMRLVSSFHRPVGTAVRVSLVLPGDSEPTELPGEVVWNRTYDEGEGQWLVEGMGVRFEKLQPAAAERIERWVERYYAEQPRRPGSDA